MSNAAIRRYLAVWYWLMALMVLSLAAAALLPKLPALIVMFSMATVKILLVARNYMHLKNERAIIYAMALVPVVFVIIFLLSLFPDLVYHATKP